MTKPVLSICIATYNRADYIGQTLESIIPQVTDEVEILIVDGASTDNTSDTVKHYTKYCRQINYIRLASKGGFDQDYSKAVEFAKGEYCWVFTDDDLLEPGAVKAVLNELAKGYSLIVVNARVMNKDLSKALENKRLPIDTNQIYSQSQMEPLFTLAITYMSFIGCVVIKRDLWLQREKTQYFGTMFIHVGVVFQAPLPGPALVIAEPYISIRLGNAQWTPHRFEIWMYKWPKLLYSFTYLSEQTRLQYCKIQSWSRLKDIITCKAMGGYSLKEYKKWFAPEESSFWWKCIVLVTALIPACLVNLLLLSYFEIMRGLAVLVIAVTPACFENLFVLSYFKKTKKEAMMMIYELVSSENNIINIVRKNILKQSHR
jgi:abequosyltransferase